MCLENDTADGHDGRKLPPKMPLHTFRRKSAEVMPEVMNVLAVALAVRTAHRNRSLSRWEAPGGGISRHDATLVTRIELHRAETLSPGRIKQMRFRSPSGRRFRLPRHRAIVSHNEPRRSHRRNGCCNRHLLHVDSVTGFRPTVGNRGSLPEFEMDLLAIAFGRRTVEIFDQVILSGVREKKAATRLKLALGMNNI